MKWFVGLLILFLLVDLVHCRKKKNKKNKKNKDAAQAVVEEEFCELNGLGGERMKVGEKAYNEAICGFCECAAHQSIICDKTVCEVDPDSCEGKHDWVPWKSVDGCFMYFCYKGKRDVEMELNC